MVRSLFVFLSLVALITVPFVMAVPSNCDPFESYQRTNQSTCPGSTMEYYANGTVLTLTASLVDCANESISSVSVFFDQIVTPAIDSNSNEWIFSYSMMWTDSATNCVVDVTSDSTNDTIVQSYNLPNDSEGFNNNPMTDISSRALNAWYTRSFTISGSQLSSFRFGFTCASSTPVKAQKQVAFIKDITWKSASNTTIIYNSLLSCVDCPRTSIAGAFCHLLDEGHRWVYNGDISISQFDVDGPLVVMGNVATDYLSVHELLDIRGCLTIRTPPEYEPKLYIMAFSESRIQIRQRAGCKWPTYYITHTADRAIGPNNGTCLETRMTQILNNYYTVNIVDNTMTIDAGISYSCYPVFDEMYLVVIIIPIVVGIAIIIAIVFGVRRYKQQKKAKKLDEEMERQHSTLMNNL